MQFIPGIHPTYEQQFNKLTEAYISGKVRPHDPCACFVGNLLNKSSHWMNARSSYGIINHASSDYQIGEKCIVKNSNGLYTVDEIVDLEAKFMLTEMLYAIDECESYYEEALFIAFEKTLELLKQIHISKGEQIDVAPVFKKRVPI